MKIKDFKDKNFIKGLELGLEICKRFAKEQGYEIHFPDINEIEIERDEELKNAK